jgi:hypothetical protein
LPDLPLSGELRRVAERLLGATGVAARARLGLPADAGADEVRRAAEEQLARWQRLALHPGSAGPLRDVAQAVVHTVERLLSRHEVLHVGEGAPDSR